VNPRLRNIAVDYGPRKCSIAINTDTIGKKKFSNSLGPSNKGNTYYHCLFCTGDYLDGLSAAIKHSNTDKQK